MKEPFQNLFSNYCNINATIAIFVRLNGRTNTLSAQMCRPRVGMTNSIGDMKSSSLRMKS